MMRIWIRLLASKGSKPWKSAQIGSYFIHFAFRHLQIDANADPYPFPAYHFDADPDPAYHFDADPNPAYHFDADADPDPDVDPDPSFQFVSDPDPQHCLALKYTLNAKSNNLIKSKKDLVNV